MKLLKSLFTITLLLLIVSCGKDESDSQPSGIKKNDNKNSTSIYPEASRMEMPKLKGGQSILLVHKTNDKYDPDGINYCVEWDKEKKSQRWSCYQMTQNSNKQNANRYYGNPQYPFDPELPSGAYFDTDLFYGSGFDHGFSKGSPNLLLVVNSGLDIREVRCHTNVIRCRPIKNNLSHSLTPPS